jgi:hypothetical protein
MCSTGMVRGLGALLALLGVVTVIMGVTITTGSSWINDLMPEDSETGEGEEQKEFANDVAGLGTLLEVGIYIFGVFMLIQGMMAVFCCGKKYAGNCMCVLLFQIFQIALFLLTFIIAIIPAGMYMISEEDLTWFCNST